MFEKRETGARAVLAEPPGNAMEIRGLSLNIGNVQALLDLDLAIKDREILAVIGPNGAGKTCLLNCVCGFYRPQKGRILFKGRDLVGLRPHRIARMGVTRTFQNIELYTGLTVLENLMAARHIHMRRGTLSCGVFWGPALKEEVKHREAIEHVIDLIELKKVRKKPVSSLPYGQRKKVDLARAICMDPEILLLDEPMAGMNVEEKEDIARFILDISELKQIPIVLVEHDMNVVMDIADRVAVLNFGCKIAEGSPESIRRNESVIQAYLGKAHVGR